MPDTEIAANSGRHDGKEKKMPDTRVQPNTRRHDKGESSVGMTGDSVRS